MGYANILYNKGLFDAALKIYQKVIAMKPQLINTYVSIMFLHQFKRVEIPKSLKIAHDIISKDPDNIYAHFIIGRNIENVEEKISTLQQNAQKYPHYLRLVNEVGISYGAKKDHRNAIKWYKKCTQIAPTQYAKGYNNIGYRTQML